MKRPMLSRSGMIFLAAMLAASLAISLVVLIHLGPRHWYILVTPKAAPWSLIFWVIPPLWIGLLLLIAAFGRYIWSRTLPQNYASWGDRMFGAGAALIVAVELVETIAVFTYWNRLTHHLGHPRGETFLTLMPDPGHLISRGMLVATGLFIAWMGNSMAKLLPPPAGTAGGADFGKMHRLSGWLFALGGLAVVLCGGFLSYPWPAVAAPMAVGLIVVGQGVIWLAFRLRGRGGGPTAAGGGIW